MDNLMTKSIPELERELLYLQSKADFISDFLSPGNEAFRVTVTLGLPGKALISFMGSDLYSSDMEKSLLGTLEELFRIKARRVSVILKDKRVIDAKLISDGFNG